jgi:hypothetical protein
MIHWGEPLGPERPGARCLYTLQVHLLRTWAGARIHRVLTPFTLPSEPG